MNDLDYQGDGRLDCTLTRCEVSQERLSTWVNPVSLPGPDATQVTAANQPLLIDAFQNSLGVWRFDGTNDRLTFAADPIGSTTSFTVYAVLRTRSLTAGTIFASDSASGPVIQFTGSRLRISFGAAYGEIVFADTRGFHAVVVRYDGSGVGNSARLRLWLDGVEWPMTYSGLIPASFAAPTAATIGSTQAGADFFAGFLGDLAFTTRALAPQQISDVADLLAARWGIPRFTSRMIIMLDGQSNAEGGGSDPDRGAFPYWYTQAGNTAIPWTSVQPKPAGTYGAEINLCRALAAAGIQPIVIKYAVNGSRLGATGSPDANSWHPVDGGIWPVALAFKQARLAELNATPEECIGCWWQGESDAQLAIYANAYAANYTLLQAAWRAGVGAPTMPIITVQLNGLLDLGTYPQRDTVRAAEANFAPLYDTTPLGAPGTDGTHYTAAQFNTAGTALAALT